MIKEIISESSNAASFGCLSISRYTRVEGPLLLLLLLQQQQQTKPLHLCASLHLEINQKMQLKLYYI